MKIVAELKIKFLKLCGKYDITFHEVCCHEAGHAFFAKLQGLNVTCIRVMSKEAGVTSIDWGRLQHIQQMYKNPKPNSVLNTSISDVKDFIDSRSVILVAGPIAQLLPGNDWAFENKNISIEAAGSDYQELLTLEKNYNIHTDYIVEGVVAQFTPSVISVIKHLANYLYLNKTADMHAINDIVDGFISDLCEKLQGK